MVNQSIVVTDHDSSYLEMIEDVLRSEGYTEVTCVVQREAFDVIQQVQPNVVLLDIHIGNEADAWRLLDKIRLTVTTKLIPVIICTTDSRIPQTKVAWLHHQHCIVLYKPFTIEDLMSVLMPIIGPPVGGQ